MGLQCWFYNVQCRFNPAIVIMESLFLLINSSNEWMNDLIGVPADLIIPDTRYLYAGALAWNIFACVLPMGEVWACPLQPIIFAVTAASFSNPGDLCALSPDIIIDGCDLNPEATTAAYADVNPKYFIIASVTTVSIAAACAYMGV